jgi:hypothetical protein
MRCPTKGCKEEIEPRKAKCLMCLMNDEENLALGDVEVPISQAERNGIPHDMLHGKVIRPL